MNLKKTALAGVVACLLATAAMAAVLNFSWTNPTQNTDGSAIPASGAGSLTETVISYGPCNATRTAMTSITGTVTRAAPNTTDASPDLPPGTWCGYAQAKNTYGQLSSPSNVSFRVVDAPVPNQPTNFSMGSSQP
jgi:hypothetical protein